MARVLHVEVEALIGRPWQYAPNGGGVIESLDGVRRFFSQYDHLLKVEPPVPIPLGDLYHRVATAHNTYQAARYDEVIAGLPDSDLRQLGSDPRRELGFCFGCAGRIPASFCSR
jgi:hypothetical protein